jgi:hypothetical protein
MFGDYLTATNSTALLFMTCLVVLISCVQQFCLVYAVMAAAQLLPRFRGIAGFVAYLAVMFLETRLTDVLIRAFVGSAIPMMAVAGVVMLACGTLYFWLSGWLLKRTLNLE